MDLEFYLMDNETSFTIISGNQHIKIKYGEYALTLANIEYNDIIGIITDFVDGFAQVMEISDRLNFIKDNHPDTVEKYAEYGITTDGLTTQSLNKAITTLQTPIRECLDNGYLNEEQRNAITDFILSELFHNIRSELFNWKDETTYIPSVLLNKELRKHMKGILKKENSDYSDSLQREMNQVSFETSIHMDDKGVARTIYRIHHTLSYLMVDLQKYLGGDTTVVECRGCKRLFYPSRSNNVYCDLKPNDGDRTCKTKKRRKKRNEFEKLMDVARGYQHSRTHHESNRILYGSVFLDELYSKWSKECKRKCEYYEDRDDVRGYKDWIDRTKFTADRLKELYKNAKGKT